MAPLIITVVRFFIFMFRMAVRLSITVYNIIVGLIRKNWRYVTFMYNWVVSKAMDLLRFVYNFLEPYVKYATYIAIPIFLIFIMIRIGGPILRFLNTLVALGMTSTPERTFLPTKTLVQNV